MRFEFMVTIDLDRYVTGLVTTTIALTKGTTITFGDRVVWIVGPYINLAYPRDQVKSLCVAPI